jgi:hypothetical protein
MTVPVHKDKTEENHIGPSLSPLYWKELRVLFLVIKKGTD